MEAPKSLSDRSVEEDDNRVAGTVAAGRDPRHPFRKYRPGIVGRWGDFRCRPTVKAAINARLVETSRIPGSLDRVVRPLANQILWLRSVDDHWFVGLGRFLACRHEHSEYDNDDNPKSHGTSIVPFPRSERESTKDTSLAARSAQLLFDSWLEPTSPRLRVGSDSTGPQEHRSARQESDSGDRQPQADPVECGRQKGASLDDLVAHATRVDARQGDCSDYARNSDDEGEGEQNPSLHPFHHWLVHNGPEG